MVELVRAGRSPEELAKEFQPSAQSIRVWVRQADLDALPVKMDRSSKQVENSALRAGKESSLRGSK